MTTDTLDRDIIDVTIPTAEDHLAAHREYCRSVIAARVPEVSEDEIADAYGITTEFESYPGVAIWTEVAERVLDAVEALEERLSRIEAGLKR